MSNAIRDTFREARERRRLRRARLPWKELEREAVRQGCSPADIFFDLAGRGENALVRPDPERSRPAS